MNITRRQIVALATLPTLVTLPSRAADPQRYVIVSLVADRLDIVGSARTTGSRIDQNSRRDIGDADGAFDAVASVAVADAVSRAEPGALALVVKMSPSKFHDSPELILQSDGVALPGAVVDAIDKERASRLILVTKQVGDASFQLAQSPVGVGRLRGVGYYVDTQTTLQNGTTGVLADGFLAPFVYARVSLVDTVSGRVMRQERVQATEVIPTYANEKANHPWQVWSPEEKVQQLTAMIKREIGRATETLLTAR